LGLNSPAHLLGNGKGWSSFTFKHKPSQQAGTVGLGLVLVMEMQK
jgi:hypothetical protein